MPHELQRTSPFTPAEDAAVILVGECFGWLSDELVRFMTHLVETVHGGKMPSAVPSFLATLETQHDKA